MNTLELLKQALDMLGQYEQDYYDYRNLCDNLRTEITRLDAMKFQLGDRVRKTKGSEWQGIIVGTYSTELTPDGYAVESEAHKGSVQIYPASALEAVE